MNVGLPRRVAVNGGEVLTSIFKSAVDGRVAIRGHNLEGDRQSDLAVHGGPHKAVYAYAFEHYDYWAGQLPGIDLSMGHFGENLTTGGLDENEVRIGDRYRFGSAVLQAAQPRMPCFKLAIRFGLPDMVRRFWLSGRSGIYFAVVEEGSIAAGDAIEKIAAGPEDLTVADVVRLYRGDPGNPGLWERLLRAPLPGSWKREILDRRAEM